ncbi:glycine--tRNA ligase subunit beta [bacterium]|nr:glycine--tRNA ligase subunit beta [bacterium]
MNHDFLLEIGCEELPPGTIDAALSQLAVLIEQSLGQSLISYQSGPVTYGTPRRLVVFIGGMADRQEDQTVELSGPPLKIAFDAQGQPTKAGLGFARKVGVPIEQLATKQTDKGEYLVHFEHKRGQETLHLLAGSIPVWLQAMTFPRSMRWTSSQLRFARPVRWLLALFGDQTVPVTIDGIRCDRLTHGHMRVDPTPFPVSSFEEYRRAMAEHRIMLEISERERAISDGLEREARHCQARLVPDSELVKTVARCTECPEIISGSFHEDFLELPRPVLITSMRTHQKFFALEDEQGILMPRFLHVIDNPVCNRDLVRQGNEKVLTARLNDARFFFREDMKTHLADRFDQTAGILFHPKLGTMADKAHRLEHLIEKIARQIYPQTRPEQLDQMKQAAHLCKVDLQTLMVGEFPELQGIMGREYSLLQGESAETAQAIFEHYLPRGAEDVLPASETGTVLSMADKMDTLCGYFKIGLVPSGSEDPYALRRQALGLCQIALQNAIDLDLEQMARWALDGYSHLPGDDDQVSDDLKAFFKRRLEALLTGAGYQYDSVNACLDQSWLNPLDLRNRLEALTLFRTRPDFEDLMVGFRRAARIIPADHETPFSETRLEEDGEIELHQTYVALSPRIQMYLDQKDYHQMLSALAEFKQPIDIFFIKVLVMCEDRETSQNRLALLQRIVALFRSFADFTRIVISQDKENSDSRR